MTTPIAPEQKEKITILLAEYTTLRNELLQKYTAILQSVGIVAPIIAGLIAFIWLDPSRRDLYLVILGLLVVYGLALWFFADRIINRITARIRTIEQDVNTRAEEQLMKWESLHGFGGLFNRRRVSWLK